MISPPRLCHPFHPLFPWPSQKWWPISYFWLALFRALSCHSKWLFFPFPMQINEVGILLIRPSPVKKFWTLDTPKETGSIGSTQRRVETLWRSIVTCQDLVVREWIFFFWDTRTSTEVYLTWSSCYWNVLVLAIFAFSRNILIMIGYHQPADLSTTRQCTCHTCYLTV